MDVIPGARAPKSRLWRRARPDLRLVRPGDPPRLRDPADDFFFFLMIAALCLMVVIFAGFTGALTGGNDAARLQAVSGWSPGSWR